MSDRKDREVMDQLKAKFIVLDGPDGCGKGTQLRLLADALSSRGVQVVTARDPGGTVIGDRVRSVLLDFDLSQMDVRCETFLFMASRAQLVGEVVEPALRAGKVVLCDRFISSTCAYQGAAGYDIQRIIELGRYAVGETWPDLTMILNVPPDEGFRRTGRKPHHAGRRRRDEGGALFNDVRVDAMEARPLEFHRRVHKLFLSLPPEYPGRIEVIEGSGPIEEVHTRILEVITRVYS